MAAWFILYTSWDDSYVLVPSQDVVYDDSVKPGDEVNYFYNKSQLDGIVKEMSGKNNVF